MTDLSRHSEGIWRSIYVFADLSVQKVIVNWFRGVMKTLGLEEYSWCYYGEVKSTDSKVNEPAHVTFRINFPGTTSYDNFRKEIEKTQWKWEDHGYDEALWVKRAYVAGTKLFEIVDEMIKLPDVPLTNNYLMLLLHGFFNDLDLNSQEEAAFYLFLAQRYLQIRYGLIVKDKDASPRNWG